MKRSNAPVKKALTYGAFSREKRRGEVEETEERRRRRAFFRRAR